MMFLIIQLVVGQTLYHLLLGTRGPVAKELMQKQLFSNIQKFHFMKRNY